MPPKRKRRRVAPRLWDEIGTQGEGYPDFGPRGSELAYGRIGRRLEPTVAPEAGSSRWRAMYGDTPINIDNQTIWEMRLRDVRKRRRFRTREVGERLGTARLGGMPGTQDGALPEGEVSLGGERVTPVASLRDQGRYRVGADRATAPGEAGTLRLGQGRGRRRAIDRAMGGEAEVSGPGANLEAVAGVRDRASDIGQMVVGADGAANRASRSLEEARESLEHLRVMRDMDPRTYARDYGERPPEEVWRWGPDGILFAQRVKDQATASRFEEPAEPEEAGPMSIEEPPEREGLFLKKFNRQTGAYEYGLLPVPPAAPTEMPEGGDELGLGAITREHFDVSRAMKKELRKRHPNMTDAGIKIRAQEELFEKYVGQQGLGGGGGMNELAQRRGGAEGRGEAQAQAVDPLVILEQDVQEREARGEVPVVLRQRPDADQGVTERLVVTSEDIEQAVEWVERDGREVSEAAIHDFAANKPAFVRRRIKRLKKFLLAARSRQSTRRAVAETVSRFASLESAMGVPGSAIIPRDFAAERSLREAGERPDVSAGQREDWGDEIQELDRLLPGWEHERVAKLLAVHPIYLQLVREVESTQKSPTRARRIRRYRADIAEDLQEREKLTKPERKILWRMLNAVRSGNN